MSSDPALASLVSAQVALSSGPATTHPSPAHVVSPTTVSGTDLPAWNAEGASASAPSPAGPQPGPVSTVLGPRALPVDAGCGRGRSGGSYTGPAMLWIWRGRAGGGRISSSGKAWRTSSRAMPCYAPEEENHLPCFRPTVAPCRRRTISPDEVGQSDQVPHRPCRMRGHQHRDDGHLPRHGPKERTCLSHSRPTCKRPNRRLFLRDGSSCR